MTDGDVVCHNTYVDVPTSRKCWKCKNVKSLVPENFYRDCRNPSGFQACCRECSKERGKQYAREHREYFKQKGREKYDPSQNQARYRKYREDYLQRRDEARKTIRGRLMDLISNARKRAAKDKLPFTITIEWALGVYEKQGGKCLLTGISFTFERNPYGVRFYFPFSPSLDQIKPGEGYTPENTRLVCVAVNIALNRFGEDVLRQVCEGFLIHNPPSEAPPGGPAG